MKLENFKFSPLLILLILIVMAVVGWTIYLNFFEPQMGIFGKMENRTIKIVNDEGEMLELEVEVADEPDERAKGFQNASKRIINNKIILFVFDSDSMPFFHMRNVVSALDIAFIKSNGEIIQIMKMVPGSPEPCGPSEPIRYAIEAKAGFFAAHNITSYTSKLIVDFLS